MTPSTKHTYLLHSESFVKWLKGDFTSGARNQWPIDWLSRRRYSPVRWFDFAAKFPKTRPSLLILLHINWRHLRIFAIR